MFQNTPEKVAAAERIIEMVDKRRAEVMVEVEILEVKQQLLLSLTNAGNPIISVVDANHGNRSELLLEHTHQGADLRLDWAGEVSAPEASVAEV